MRYTIGYDDAQATWQRDVGTRKEVGRAVQYSSAAVEDRRSVMYRYCNGTHYTVHTTWHGTKTAILKPYSGHTVKFGDDEFQ